MSDGGDSYWDDPDVQAAEAAYSAAQEADRESARFDRQMREAKENLDAAREKWQREHPHEKPPWRHAMDEGDGEPSTPFGDPGVPFGGAGP